jgi:hypothetical protein
MNLSDDDRTRLDQLAALRDAGDISNEEYQRLCWATIRERGIKHGDYSEQAFLDAAKEDPVFRPEDPRYRPSVALSVAALTTCTPSRMQQYHRSQRYSKRNTGITNHLAMNKLLKRFSGSRTTAGHAMLFPKRRISPLIAAVVLLLTIGGTIYLGQHKFPWSRLSSGVGVVLEPEHRYDFITPLFGAQAVSLCKWRCGQIRSGGEKELCEQGCRYFSLVNYGRRVSLKAEEWGPKNDIKMILAQCLEQEVDAEAHRLDKEWRTRVRQAARNIREANSSSTLGDFKAARERYLDSFEINKKLMMPPSREKRASELSENIIRATCLRAHLTLSEMALGIVKTRSDKFSEDYYSEIWRSLEQKTTAAEKKVLSDERAIELLASAAEEGE